MICIRKKRSASHLEFSRCLNTLPSLLPEFHLHSKCYSAGKVLLLSDFRLFLRFILNLYHIFVSELTLGALEKVQHRLVMSDKTGYRLGHRDPKVQTWSMFLNSENCLWFLVL